MNNKKIIRIIERRVLIMVSFFVFAVICCAQDYVSVMFYNCENTFDIQHDEGKDDYDFLPTGTRNWSRYRFYNKLKGIAKVIAMVDESQPVGLVGLCEVENDTVLTYLTERTMLHRIGYKYVMTHSDDRRGMDVALLYQPFLFRMIGEPKSLRSTDLYKTTRDVLRVGGQLVNGDTVFVYVCHLPSKLGGREAESSSRKIMNMVVQDIDTLQKTIQNSYFIVMGDFNADMSSPLFKQLKEHSFVDLMEGRNGGTYKYHGAWSILDHILVSSSFLSYDASLRTSFDDSGILSSPYLLENDNMYGGHKPRRTYLWTKYNGGISDHLPVWMRIRW